MMDHKRAWKFVLLVTVLVGLFFVQGTGTTLAGRNPPDRVVGVGRYIVVFRDDVRITESSDFAASLAEQYGFPVQLHFRHALRGMTATLTPGQVNRLKDDPRVAFVEPDHVIRIDAQAVPTGIQRVFADDNPQLAINGVDDYRVDVDVAVIDSGIDLQHPDLNVVAGVSCTNGFFTVTCVDGGDDDNGHGTHVAGIIGALDNGQGVVGVAPGARLWSVKVLNRFGSGWSSWVIAGIDYVTAHADQIEVANLSLGAQGTNQAQALAISNSIAAGVTYVTSAGNNSADAANYYPANHPDIIAVSALADFDGKPGGLGSPTCRADVDDTLADFSNHGSVIDIAAPGTCITSTLPLESGAYGVMSGTSMASPHVAGAAALLASTGSYTPAQIRSILIGEGNQNWVDDSGDGIQEPLLDISNASVFDPVLRSVGQDAPPAVDISSPTAGATVSGVVTITAAASDDTGVDQVEFFLDGVSLGLDDSAGNGWSLAWDTSASVDGEHTIRATATDSIGQAAFDEVSVTVQNAVDEPPTVHISSPTAGATVSGEVTITAAASDDQGVAQVEFFLDGVSLGVDSNGGNGWALAWDTSASVDGAHTIRATATDSIGQTADDEVVVTTHNAVDEPPAVDISSPTAGATVSGVVTITAAASDDTGVDQVEFFLDSVSLGVDDSAGDGWSLAWDTTASVEGEHTIRATATDSIGQTADDEIVVTVHNAVDEPPTVHISSPTAGATVSGVVTITAAASDETGVDQVEFFLDGVSLGVDDSAGDGWSLAWDTGLSDDGSHALRATATDSAGQTADDEIILTVANDPGGPEIELTASSTPLLTVLLIRLSWDGATTPMVDIYRNDVIRWTTNNDGNQADFAMQHTGSYSYRICEAGTSHCSNTVTIDS